jgi:formimidoylglutamate deiminase
MKFLYARKALLQKGWADNVRLSIRAGRIQSVELAVTPQAGDFVAGCVIPGLCNAHSHAFQRALAGHTEQRSPAGKDSFWTWRERMYELAGLMSADRLSAVASQAYNEMLASGYTSVAEFHYLHREPGTVDTDDTMFTAIRSAAGNSGIRMTYVPVLYERAGFDSAQVKGQQKHFALDLESFAGHFERARAHTSEIVNVGIGAHSLRAVSEESLRKIAELATSNNSPMHLHIAEQQLEIDQCLAATGRRPVDWLLENLAVDERWCLVHATHMDVAETEALAKTGAVVCLCPSTEANLGDGLFPLHAFLSAGGKIAIGSDSHISINPFEELRWLEYGQRLATQSRNITSLRDSHVGSEIFLRALQGGAQISTQVAAELAVGAAADLVVLNDDDPMLVGHSTASLLDALVFSGYRLPVERVMVHGEWRVIDGNHVNQEETRKHFAATLRQMGAAR